MDLDEFRSILSNSRADVWEIIDAAITLASTDYAGELKRRRDGIVERLYTQQQCSNCDVKLIEQPTNGGVVRTSTVALNDDRRESPVTPRSVPGDDEDERPDPFGGLFDDEQTKILTIKEQLEDPHQNDDDVIELLQTLADMDITFTGLKETDIGRHVNRFRKHPSNEVRSLVKQLVRKWKDLVDEWVGSNVGAPAPATLTDGDSPLVQNVPRSARNGHHQVPDFGYSPNPHNGSSGSERNNSEPEQQRAKTDVSRKAVPSRPAPQPRPAMVASASAPPNRANNEQSIDLDRLASARKRLHENYEEAQNAKKQRKIQVMDIHEIPKPRNGFIAKNKGNFLGRHK
ncbi:hypothetical protein SSX86_012722 [Deinandra increscens subsp. villosa]|uniref:TFIIS N-terminal domain-containing protein n=1 Tax=Deinandra increscens subsp. villosa TaxID=3103831 RepID=A0AAP0H1S4_9ASTR